MLGGLPRGSEKPTLYHIRIYLYIHVERRKISAYRYVWFRLFCKCFQMLEGIVNALVSSLFDTCIDKWLFNRQTEVVCPFVASYVHNICVMAATPHHRSSPTHLLKL